jgi:CMP-N-acetylneuraminic acid synthetase
LFRVARRETFAMNVDPKEVWAVIPARGGSKSIPLKNLVPLDGRPLIEYVIRSAQKSRTVSRILCSTEDARIAETCEDCGIEVHPRPRDLARDDTPVLDVLVHLLEDLLRKEGRIPDLLPLLQPTSPFVLPRHIDTCVQKLQEDPTAESSQTITAIPHNFHAFNQRILEAGVVRFRFPREREVCYNKQSKPAHYAFGNLVVMRSSSLLERGQIFGDRSIPVIIDPPYALDLDTGEDLDTAQWFLRSGKVLLDHLGG